MTIDEKLIARLELLSRLELSEAERESLRGDLNAILAMVEKLGELDTEGLAPLSHPGEAKAVLRPDEVGGEVEREEALRNAPDQDGRFFRVPKVIDK